jgi:hypothetical protein
MIPIDCTGIPQEASLGMQVSKQIGMLEHVREIFAFLASDAGDGSLARIPVEVGQNSDPH